jgi:hypothetical protein
MAKPKPGRKPYSPTPEQRAVVKAMSGYGVIQDEIAAVLDIDDKTLRKYFAAELRTAAIEANAAVAQSLFQNATKHRNVAAQIFWLRTRGGWRDPLQHQLAGANGETLMIVTGVVRDADEENASRQPPRQIGIYDAPAGSAD